MGFEPTLTMRTVDKIDMGGPRFGGEGVRLSTLRALHTRAAIAAGMGIGAARPSGVRAPKKQFLGLARYSHNVLGQNVMRINI